MKTSIASVLLASAAVIGATRTPPPTHPITGHVLDATRGTPIAGALVVLSGADSTRTASDGSFRIPNLASNTNVLSISPDGYPSLRVPELVAPPKGNLDVAVRLRSSSEPADSAEGGSPLYIVHLRPDSEVLGAVLPTIASISALNHRRGDDSIFAIMLMKAKCGPRCYGDAGAHGVIIITFKSAVRKSRTC